MLMFLPTNKSFSLKNIQRIQIRENVEVVNERNHVSAYANSKCKDRHAHVVI